MTTPTLAQFDSIPSAALAMLEVIGGANGPA